MISSHGRRSRAACRVSCLALSLGLTATLGVGSATASANNATRSSSGAVASSPRVERLLAQMTLDEKLQTVSGGPEPSATNQYEAGYLPGIPRLGIPSLRLAD